MAEITLTDENFNNIIQKSERPILVDFWAEWCGPCQITGPILSEVAKEMEGKVDIGKLNVETNPMTANMFKVNSIPTMIVFKGGKPIEAYVGARPKDFFIERLNIILKQD